jgi:hypothetical protein
MLNLFAVDVVPSMVAVAEAIWTVEGGEGHGETRVQHLMPNQAEGRRCKSFIKSTTSCPNVLDSRQFDAGCCVGVPARSNELDIGCLLTLDENAHTPGDRSR